MCFLLSCSCGGRGAGGSGKSGESLARLRFGPAHDIEMNGDVACLSHNRGVEIVSVADSRRPSFADSFNDGGESNNAFASGRVLYVSDADKGILKVMDISNPRQPVKVKEYGDCRPHAVIVRNDILYVATTGKGLHVMRML